MSNVTKTVSTGIPFWDMMLSFGKASQSALSGYGSESLHAPQTAHATSNERTAKSGDVEIVALGEETLNVGTRLVTGEITRVRRIVVETPVEREVALREERVIVERRKPTAAAMATTDGLFRETTFEMSDSFEVVTVWKSARVTEEVVLRREVTHRHETVRDTVRHDEIVVEQASRTLPAARRGVEHRPERQNTPAWPVVSPNTAKLSADSETAADRSQAAVDLSDKASATARSDAGSVKADFSAKAEQKAPAPQPLALQPSMPQPKAVAEPASKAPVSPPRPDANVAHGDKAPLGNKG